MARWSFTRPETVRKVLRTRRCELPDGCRFVRDLARRRGDDEHAESKTTSGRRCARSERRRGSRPPPPPPSEGGEGRRCSVPNPANESASATATSAPSSNGSWLLPEAFEALSLVDPQRVARALEAWSPPAPPDVGGASRAARWASRQRTSATRWPKRQRRRTVTAAPDSSLSIFWSAPSPPRLGDSGPKPPRTGAASRLLTPRAECAMYRRGSRQHDRKGSGGRSRRRRHGFRRGAAAARGDAAIAASAPACSMRCSRCSWC